MDIYYRLINARLKALVYQYLFIKPHQLQKNNDYTSYIITLTVDATKELNVYN